MSTAENEALEARVAALEQQLLELAQVVLEYINANNEHMARSILAQHNGATAQRML